jgi:DsbC/DsbD-like thiol-disulfide interchange protein
MLGALAAPAAAEPTSPWVSEGAASLRLVDAGQGPVAGSRLAAIAIRLDPGWKTYWRQPGASGVPPRFDFSQSSNLAEAAVSFPTPERAADADGVTNVYHDSVVIPVTVRPRDPSAPVSLRLVADYGLCEAVCVPAHSEAALELAPGGGKDGPAAAAVRKAVELTPKPAQLGADGELSVKRVWRTHTAAGTLLEIEVGGPPGVPPLLFAETGDGDFAPAPEAVGEPSGGRAQFRMAFSESELPKSGLRLTLAAGDKAIETPVSLDAIVSKP